MLGRDGKKAYYNIQFGTDAKHKMIVMAETTDDTNDLGLIKRNHETIKEQMEIEAEELEADKGYGNIGLIKEIEDNLKTKCYIPLQQQKSQIKDKKNNIEFIYDKEKDEYLCPTGKKLKRHSEKKHRKQIYIVYKCNDCNSCKIRDKCTQAKKGRRVHRNIHQEWIDQYKSNLETKTAKEKVRERKALVEHPFGTLKLMMGKHCFLLTSKPKVQTELNIYTTAYNLKRLINIESMERIMKQILSYKWKIA
ncbi:MAG: transposase [Bacteroidales bacterium]